MKLRELRGNYTQEQMANKLGLNRQTYRGYEMGDREPDFKTLIHIADYFDVSIDYLLGHETKDIIKRPSAELMGEKEQNLLKMYKLMTERQQIEYYGIGIGMLQASGVDISLFVS